MNSHNETQTLLSASGYCYHSGSKNFNEFKESYGFSPFNYPEFFYVTKYHTVIATDKYNEWCKLQFRKTEHNYLTLGITVR